jgi:hypothetical protein
MAGIETPNQNYKTHYIGVAGGFSPAAITVPHRNHCLL